MKREFWIWIKELLWKLNIYQRCPRCGKKLKNHYSLYECECGWGGEK